MGRALVGNAADPKQVRRANQAERLRQQRELDDLRHVMGTRQGRRFVWRQLSAAGVFRLSFTYAEPETTIFNEGRRSMGLNLMAEIHQLDPAHYLTMANEAAADAQAAAPIDEPKPKTEENDDA